jgi:hypothetical protein
MTQLNTPYPSTAYLTGFLRSRGIAAVQEDLALALVLRLFSARRACSAVREASRRSPKRARRTWRPSCEHFDDYRSPRRAGRRLPAGARSVAGAPHRRPPSCPRARASPRSTPMSIRRRRRSAGLGLRRAGRAPTARATSPRSTSNDIADVLREAVDPRFEFVRYAESLAQSQASFEPLAQALAAPKPDRPHPARTDAGRAGAPCAARGAALGALPGNVYGAFRIAQAIKAQDPRIVTVLGGGFVNTELRELAEPRVFDFFDYVTLDDGERPLLALLEHLRGERRAPAGAHLPARGGRVRYVNGSEPDLPFAEAGTPTWDGLPLDRYLSLLDMLNPMHRLWSDARWNKLTVAHGCYWKKCSFCDVSLDYISRYEALAATDAGRSHRGHRRRDRADRLPFRRRGRAAQGAAALAARVARSAAGRSRGGATSASKRASPRSCAPSWPMRLHRRLRRAGGGLGPPARS